MAQTNFYDPDFLRDDLEVVAREPSPLAGKFFSEQGRCSNPFHLLSCFQTSLSGRESERFRSFVLGRRHHRAGRGKRRTSSTSRSERSKSLRRPSPVASEPMSPTPKSPKGVRASVKSARRLLTPFRDYFNLAPTWSRLLFRRETKPGRKRSGSGPEKQIPIPYSYPYPSRP